MLQNTLNNLNHDIALVQLYVKNSQEAGFNDMARLLEALSIKLFAATYGFSLRNKNLFHANFPAIDLADDSKRVAIQVTTNADAKKIHHTLKVFGDHNLGSDYDALIIFGFLKRSKIKNLPDFCRVVCVGDLVSALADKNDEDLVQNVVDAVKQHSDFARIHPYDDRNCLEIILNCIDRNAIKHRMYCEGSHGEMLKGLNEITELISKGTINRRLKGKSVDDFQDSNIKKALVSIRDLIGRIVAIVNEGRQEGSDFVYIQSDRYDEIDKLKRRILDVSNEIAQSSGIAFRIQMIQLY